MRPTDLFAKKWLMRSLAASVLALMVVMFTSPLFAQTAPAAAPATAAAAAATTAAASATASAPAAPNYATPSWLSKGDTAWQLIAATVVGMQSIPGLAILYGGVVKKKWAINSAFMVFYAFAAVLICWLLWAYNMGFGPQWLAIHGNGFLGQPTSIAGTMAELNQGIIPGANAASPFSAPMFPMAAMVYFQFVFAAITLILIAGSLFGRMSFVAWMLFVPLWLTFSYTVGAYSLWGGGFLALKGVIDYSGGYVIHLAAGVTAFTAAAIIGPRLAKDRTNFKANNILMVLAGAGMVWLGWNGFNGGDPYSANADAAVAVLNTNVATALALLVWMTLDYVKYGKPSVLGAVNGMIAGLVAITPSAGVCNGYGALLVGVCAGSIPWFTMNVLGSKLAVFKKVDDCLGVIHTHGFAGLVGGLLVGLVATPQGESAFGCVNTNGGLFYGGGFTQLVLQLEGAGFIIALNIVLTVVILYAIKIVTPLRMSDAMLEVGDHAVHGEEAYGLAEDDDEVPAGAI